MFGTFTRARTALAFFACATACASAPAVAAGDASISGIVDDAATGLPAPGARVRVEGTKLVATADRAGAFAFAEVPPGSYRLRVDLDGYQSTDSEEIAVSATGRAPSLTLAIERTNVAGNANVRTIAVTATRATESLQRASTIYRSVSPQTQIADGFFRTGDALRQLPGINNQIGGDTASLGDDLQLQIRGLGTNETTALLDGHPIAFGVPGGYNYQLTPAFGLRNINVTYGSAGTELTGYDAIGGIVDQQTLEPTRTPHATFLQGYGTFDRADTDLTFTGTTGRLGYALAYGVGSLNGPFHDESFYQPGAAYDPSATSPAVRALAVYKDSGTTVQRSGLQKLRYDLSDATNVTLTGFQSDVWEDKTGNGDGDFADPAYSLALGRASLAGKGAKDPCPAGSFTAITPANGAVWGTGPNGLPDGGAPCQTPQSYANAITGFQGAGTAWQAFNLDDEDVRFETNGAHQQIRVDAFTDRYLNTVDRTFALPFVKVPGDNGFFNNTAVSTSGVQAYDDFEGRNNELGIGFEYLNDAYDLRRNGTLRGAPIVHELTEFVRDAYHPHAGPLSAYASLYLKRSTVTNTSYADPRVSLVYEAPGKRDVFRVAAGATTTQPTADLVDQAFTPGTFLTAGGGGGISCGSLNSVGSAPSSLLKPERGVDEEVGYGHRFDRDSQVQVTFYNTNVYGKIYANLTPLATTGTGFIDPATLLAAEQFVRNACGTNDPLALLGVSGSINLGQLRAQGFTVTGRQRISPGTFFDYDYATTSTVLRSAPIDFLQNNLTSVIGSQVPYLPLHTLDFAVDGRVTPAFDLRYTLHAISDNNNKHSGGYNYSELRGAFSLPRGTFTASVFNLFDQDAFLKGYLGEGVPLQLNQYATAAAYAPLIGANATERFGIPYRSFFASYAIDVP